MVADEESNSERKKKLEAALKEKDWGEVRSIAHAIKGSATSFGYPNLSKLAEKA